MTVKKSFLNYIDIGSWNIHGLTEEINGSKHYKSNEDEFFKFSLNLTFCACKKHTVDQTLSIT